MERKECLKKLCLAYGPSGHEDIVASLITEMVKPYVDEIYRDVMGNLIAFKKGTSGKKIMLAGHMDQIGLMVVSADEKGFLRVAAVGGVSPWNMLYRHVRFENGTEGCVGMDAKHDNKPTVTDLFIDIGVSTKEDAYKKVQVGDMCVVKGDFVDMGSRVSCMAMDNRTACGVLIEVLKAVQLPRDDIYAVFTVQEELGLRGAKTAAAAILPDVGIAIDITSDCGAPGTEKNCAMELGKGVAIKIRDASVFCSPAVISWMEETAKAEGIPHQREVLTHGGTDTAAMQLAGTGVHAGCLSISCRYIHSMAETIQWSDYDASIDLLAALLRKGWSR